jgi:amidase
MSDLPFNSATSQLKALRSGEITSRELLEVYLQRVEVHNATLNAIVTLDADRAREEADAADAARARGEDRGVLGGLPITVKDSYETAGMRTVCGRKDLADNVPRQDAEAVSRLRRSGAIIIGKTNMPPGNQDVQADNPVFGPSNNPWDLTRTSGGSAGGGAVATAVGLAGFDFGSEIGGSTRIPAHFNGLYGHKATWRSIPLVGHIPNGPGTGRWADMDLACPGAQVRDARDLAPILVATTGPMARDGGFSYTLAPPRARRLSDFRVAVWYDDPSCPIDTDVSGAIQDVIAVLRAGGAKVTIQPTSLPVDIATSHRAFEPLVYAAFGVDRTGITPRFAAGLAARLLQHPRGDALAALRGTFQSHYSWLKADAARHEIRQRWQEFYDEFDVVLMPVTPTAAPPHHGKLIDRFGRHFDVDGSKRSYWDQTKWNAIANIAGTPATTIPVKRNAAGLPVGVQAMGPAGGDLTTVEFAALVGAELDGYQRPPAFAK